MDEALRRIFEADQQQAVTTNWRPVMGLMLAVYRSCIAEGATIQEASILAGTTFRELLAMAERKAADEAKAGSEDDE